MEGQYNGTQEVIRRCVLLSEFCCDVFIHKWAFGMDVSPSFIIMSDHHQHTSHVTRKQCKPYIASLQQPHRKHGDRLGHAQQPVKKINRRGTPFISPRVMPDTHGASSTPASHISTNTGVRMGSESLALRSTET